MKRIWVSFIFIIGVLFFLNACGGSSSNSTASDVKNPTPIQNNTKVGYFSSVKGLQYKTTSGITGIIDDDGFEYKEGDRITFSIDKLILGTVPAKAEITILDFNNSDRVAQALYGLDEDKEINNGIDVSYLTTSSLVSNEQKVRKLYKNNNLKLISLQDVSNNDEVLKKYYDFMKLHNALIIPTEQASILAFQDEIIRNDKIKKLIKKIKNNQNFIKRIIYGIALENDINIIYRDLDDFINSTGYTLYKNSRVLANNYSNRIMSIALSLTRIKGDNLIYQKANNAVIESKEKEELRRTVENSVGYIFDIMDSIIDIYKNKGITLNNFVDTNINTTSFALKQSKILGDDKVTNAVVGLALDVAKDCINEKGMDKKSCYNTVLKNVGSSSLKAFIDDPMFDEVIDKEFELWTTMIHVKNPRLMLYDIVKIIVKNGLSIGMGIEELYSLNMNETDIEALKTALNIFMLIRSQAGPDLVDEKIFTNQTLSLFSGNEDSSITNLISTASYNYLGVGLDASYNTVRSNIEVFLAQFMKIDKNQEYFDRYCYSEDILQHNCMNHHFNLKVEEYLIQLDKMYINNYYMYYNYWKSLNSEHNKVKDKYNEASFVQQAVDFEIKNIKLIQKTSNIVHLLSEVAFDSSAIGAIFRPKSCQWDISSSLFVEGQKEEQLFNRYEKELPKRNIFFDTDIILDSINTDEDITEVPFLISVKCDFISREVIKTYEDNKKQYQFDDKKLYIAQFEKAKDSKVNIDAKYKIKSQAFLVNVNVEDNRIGQKDEEYAYYWNFNTGKCNKVIETDIPQVIYQIPKECYGDKTYVIVNVHDLLEDTPFVTSGKVYLDQINMSDDNLNVYVSSKSGKSGDIIEIAPKVTGSYTNIIFDYSYGEGLEKIFETDASIHFKLINNTSSLIKSYVDITVTNEKGESVSASANIYIAPLPKKKQGIITFIPLKETYKDGTLIQAGEEIAKQWVIKNITEETLQNVYLKWSASSYSKLEHKKEIEIGDIAPNEEATIALNISVPSDGVVGTHYGKFTLWYQDSDGKEQPLKYTSGIDAYVIYKLIVKDESEPEEPIVDPIDIDTYSISNNGDTKVDGEEYQKYRMSIKLTQKPQVVKLESESGSTYYLLKDGKVQSKPAFVTDMSYSSDKKNWTVDFRIKKDSDEQHKKFKLIVQDARAEGSNDMIDSEVYEYVVAEATPVQIESFTISEKDENDEYQWFTMKIKTSRKLKTLLFKSDSKTYYGLLSNWKRVSKIKTKDDDEFRDTSEDFDGLFPSITVRDNNQVWEIVFRIRKDTFEQNKYFYLAVKDSFDKTAKEKKEYTVKAK